MLVSENRLAVCAVLESHVDVKNLDKVCKVVFRNWAWTSNGDLCERGTRIILGWNSDVVDLMVLSQEDQVIHTQICPKHDNNAVFCSFVYAKNSYQERRRLWETLCIHKSLCHDKPCVVMGDFNSALHVEDSLYGPSTGSIGMREFHDCVQYTELVDINGHGLHYTWNQKPKQGIGLLKKIDRVMGNLKFLEMFPEAFVCYLPFRISDHTPCILKWPNSTKEKPKPFKFANFITSKPEFRNARGRIQTIQDVAGNRFEGDNVPSALVHHYENFLGHIDQVSSINMEDLDMNVLSSNDANIMVRQVTREEVKNAMFSIAENKAAGPDGYTSAFFKNAWDIVGNDVSNAVLEFFDNGKLLKQLNHTILALVPKVETPDSVLDYRPISCCNVLYKCISKIITDRLKGSLGVLVSINQSAFVPGRKISDNILLTQELMHNYHLNRGPARCAFKIDIQKAYDTVSWSFLESVLHGFGLHRKMIAWIMACVTSVTYSISLNGNLHGYFKGRRGLRQGDPMSPYLFTLVMEILSLLLQRGACPAMRFKFHAHCAKQKIINVSFADDLFIFVHGDVTLFKKVRDALELFTNASGLKPSPAKSTVYFYNVPHPVKQEILQVMPFNQGTLPVKYLGVPLISTKLMSKDCKPLLDRMEKKIDSWLNKSLSFAGRLQLINSVLSSVHIYWASVFIIPARVTNDLEKLMRRFLWNANNQGRVKGKVPWAEISKKFTRFNANELDARARYDVLQTRPEEYPRQACMDLLALVNQLDRFNNLITGPLRIALTTRLRSVHECTMEFYSTFTFNSRGDPFDNDRVAFRCGGTRYSISMAQFGSIVRLYTEEDSGNEENTGGVRDLDENERQATWAQIGDIYYTTQRLDPRLQLCTGDIPKVED
ncbi:uncharacterized protein LOC110870522 [Helianthus annuus]|uniref:uncharacterized protein LOC110870522 n=1 Tax=Helianthus annuus TaxID=4232 RepID=UPI000B8F0273|nr:uncharacterized protein LOC110870522 [Helianthus annuus]